MVNVDGDSGGAAKNRMKYASTSRQRRSSKARSDVSGDSWSKDPRTAFPGTSSPSDPFASTTAPARHSGGPGGRGPRTPRGRYGRRSRPDSDFPKVFDPFIRFTDSPVTPNSPQTGFEKSVNETSQYERYRDYEPENLQSSVHEEQSATPIERRNALTPTRAEQVAKQFKSTADEDLNYDIISSNSGISGERTSEFGNKHGVPPPTDEDGNYLYFPRFLHPHSDEPPINYSHHSRSSTFVRGQFPSPYFQEDFTMPRPEFFSGSQKRKQKPNDLPKGRPEPPLEWGTWDSLKLWIKDLPPNVTTLELWTNFKKLGNIESIDIFVSKAGLKDKKANLTLR